VLPSSVDLWWISPLPHVNEETTKCSVVTLVTQTNLSLGSYDLECHRGWRQLACMPSLACRPCMTGSGVKAVNRTLAAVSATRKLACRAELVATTRAILEMLKPYMS
jgi:hypothetical protein